MSVMIATPMFGAQNTEQYFTSCVALTQALNQEGVPHAFYTITNESLIPRARNTCVAAFLKTEFTHLFFIDADIMFTPDDVARLWNLEADVAVGCYPMKKATPVPPPPAMRAARAVFDEWAATYERPLGDPDELIMAILEASGAMFSPPYALWVDGKLVDDLDKFDSPVEADFGGTGFMMIKRSVFERMIEAYPETAHNEGHIGKSWALFDTEVFNDCYLSEDYLFCRRWRDIGGTIAADPKVRLKHVGQFVYG